MTDASMVREFTAYLLFRFLKLRESATISLVRLQRISLEQFDSLIDSLLSTPSGGRFPVLIAVAAFQTIKDFFAVPWEVRYQGINVADSQTGAGGDVTISQNGAVVLALEVTERPLDRARVAVTFNTKVTPHGIEDYLFLVRTDPIEDDVRHLGWQYFAQGHEINFVQIKPWILMILATMGRRGRDLFNQHLLRLLDEESVPRVIKVAWNRAITALTELSQER